MSDAQAPQSRPPGSLLFLLGLVLSNSTFAAPTTAPALPPASTPKEALRSLNLALRNGNAEHVRSLFITDDPESARLISAMADYASALAALHRAAEKSYGHDGANMVTGDLGAQSADGLAAIDKAEESIDGNHATVKFTGATDPPVQLKKVDGRWKLPLTQLLEGADRAAKLRRLKELLLQSRLAQQTADEINAGKYKEGPSRAAAVWRSRLLASPTTRPTTAPSK